MSTPSSCFPERSSRDAARPAQRFLKQVFGFVFVTAAFNLNLLHRINRELDGTVPVEEFRHIARWNDAEARIEMHLEARCDVHFRIDGRPFSIAAGDAIHTENSIKYGPRDARVLLRAGGWNPIAEWTDPGELFSLILAVEGAAPSVPHLHPHIERPQNYRESHSNRSRQ